MYERFTDRARKVMQLANQEAQRLNHEYIKPEHVLIGICKEGGGIVGEVFKFLELDPGKIRIKAEEALDAAGDDTVSFGKVPHNPAVKKVIEAAMETARTRNNNYVGTEHLMFGLLRDKESAPYQILTEVGLTEACLTTTLGSGAFLEQLPDRSLIEKMSLVAAGLGPDEKAERIMREITSVTLLHMICYSDPKVALNRIKRIIEAGE